MEWCGITKQPGFQAFTGRSLKRREDRRLLTGRAEFTGDIQLSGMLYAAFLRSPYGHARIKSIDVSQALAMAGVVAVYTGADLKGEVGPLPDAPIGVPKAYLEQVEAEDFGRAPEVLPTEEAIYAGQAIAVAVADSRARAEDALEAIQIEWEPLPVVTDPEEAMKPGAPAAFSVVPDNIHCRLRVHKGEFDLAAAAAPHRLQERIYTHRYMGAPMECRGLVCQWDERRQTLKVWLAGQGAHFVRSAIANSLGLAMEQVEVWMPDVGGGFGPKLYPYVEYNIVGFISMQLKQPVKWVEDRREHFQSLLHARDKIHNVDVAFDDEGRILALRTRVISDVGAYNPNGFVDIGNGAAHMLGPYKVDHYDYIATCVGTNKAPHAAYRGAGRPEVVLPMERIMDRVAQHLGLDPAEVRRRNLVQPEEMPYAVNIPYRDGERIVYDSGDYPACLDKALAAVNYDEIRRKQPEWWRQGKYVGVGIAFYNEGTGVGPFEGARVRIDPKGRIVVITGSGNHGQGHETVFAQVAADVWQTDPDEIIVISGDTVRLPYGLGTFASRSMVTAGMALYEASQKVQEKVRLVAGHMLEVSPNDLEIVQGRVQVRGAPSRSVSLAEVARAAAPGPYHGRPEGVDADLEAVSYYVPPTVTWSYATHVARVEVDIDTAIVDLQQMVVAHDAGVIVNPMLADGQVTGGVVQGIGGALYEELVYDENGQLLTSTMMDYLLPTAMETPKLDLVHLSVPSPLNPLGVKGLGEGGAIGPPAAIVAAVEDALRPLGIRISRTPVTPERLFRLIEAARQAEAQAG